MTATPALDAVRVWLDNGMRGPAPWPARPETPATTLPDWPPMSHAERCAAVIRACASGAPALEGRRYVVDRNGRRIPPPPGYQ